MKVSIVVPLHDEAPNVEQLYRELRDFADKDSRIAEIILVDDGSKDETFDLLKRVTAGDPRVTVIRLRRNFGQTAALAAGFDVAKGDVICPMDGDLQNDPNDIPALLDKINEGYDVASGWREDRKDRLLTRRIPSWFANRIISRITNVRLHDYGCALKAYRAEVLHGINLYGEMHRFIPSLASWMGIRVAEIPVSHRPRVGGRSKYGLSRVLRVVLDLINVKFLISYSTRPIQVFGQIGMFSFLVAIISAAITLYMKYLAAERYNITGNPFFILAVLCVLVGFQFICIGLLGELTIRTYYELQQKPTYVIREKFKGAGSDPGSKD